MLKSVKLQEFMDRRGLTQQQLADEIGVTRGVIGKWNTQVSDVTRENCAKLLLAGMTIEEIFGEEVAECVKKSVLEEANISTSNIVLNHAKTSGNALAENREPIDYQDPKFLAAIEKGMALIEERKKQGIK